jgi:hypothetical protein
MAAFALSTNLYSFAQTRVDQPFFGWPTGTGEAEVIRQLARGDIIVPKFAASPLYSEGDDFDAQKDYCERLGLDYDDMVAAYEETVQNGHNAVPFQLRVESQLEDDDRPSGAPWARVAIEIFDLPEPLSAKEFLLLRAVPPALAAQFKGTVSRGRHLQKIPATSVREIREAAAAEDRRPFLRQYSLVEASSPESAAQILIEGGRSLAEGDRAFLASAGGLLGVHDVDANGTLD